MSGRKHIADYFDRKATSFDAIYSGRKGPLRRAWDQLTRKNLQDRFEFTMRAVPSWAGKRVLDVGCGSGRYGIELAAQGAVEVVGLDVSAEMLALAAELAKQRQVDRQCRFLREDVAEFEDQAGFDVVIANGFFDYLPQPEPVLARLRPLTREMLIASFPTRWALRVPFRRAWFLLHRCKLRFFTRRGIIELCRQTGFTCKTLTRRGPIYMLIAEPRQ